MSLPDSSPAGLEVCWTSRPPGVRLTGALDAASDAKLEQCLAELSDHLGPVRRCSLMLLMSAVTGWKSRNW